MPIETIILRILAYIALATAIIIILRYLRPFFAKLVFGAYNLRYVKYYKKLTKTNPYPYCHKEDIPSLINDMNPSKYREAGRLGDEEFGFEGIPAYITFKEIRKVYGHPLCFNIGKYKNLIIRLAGYTCDDYTEPIDIIYYFTDYCLLAGEYQCKSQNGTDKREILMNLIPELTAKIPDDFKGICFTGKNMVILINDNGFSLSVKYLNIEEFRKIVH